MPGAAALPLPFYRIGDYTLRADQIARWNTVRHSGKANTLDVWLNDGTCINFAGDEMRQFDRMIAPQLVTNTGLPTAETSTEPVPAPKRHYKKRGRPKAHAKTGAKTMTAGGGA